MEMLEKLIETFSPRTAALRRYWRLRAKRLYEAANSSIYHRRPGTQGRPDLAMDKARERVRDWARHLDENHDLAIGVLDELVNKIVGTGIVLEPVAASSRGRINERVNRDIAKLWQRWTMKPEVTGEISFGEVQRLAARTWLRDGEILGQHVQGNTGRIQHLGGLPYSIELIEADFLPFNLNDDRRRIVHGVEKNAWGRPTAYHLLKRAPETFPGFQVDTRKDDTRRITSDRIMHLKFCRRVGQTRGISIFHGVAFRLDDIKDYEESERIAAKVGASFTAFIRKGTDFDPTAAAEVASERGSDYREMELTAGMIFDNLLPGEEIGTIDTNRPNTSLEAFRNSQLRATAAGTGTSYSSIAKSYEGNYSSQRQELVESYPGYDKLRNYFVAAFLQPIYEKFIETAILSGALAVPASVDPDSLLMPAWIPPARPWIDPLKEIQADELAVAAGFKTRAQVIRERTGRDPATVKQQIELELDEQTPAKAAAPAPAPADPPADDTEPNDENDEAA